ncbi:MAG: tetratricopeptide repeat protein, partial [Syntrophobacteria bacterium]
MLDPLLHGKMKRRIPIRQLEQERLAAKQARGRRGTIFRKMKWIGLFVCVVAVIGGVTYGLFFAPYTSLRNMLPMPKRLVSVIFIVNEVQRSVPAEGTLVVHPADVVKVDDVRTDGRFNWGLRFHSEQFSANELLEGRRQIKEFWPEYDYNEPLEVSVKVMAGSHSIGGFHMVVRLRARDWVEKAQAADSLGEKLEYYEHAARLAPENPLILSNLAELYAEQGRWDKAAATYDKVAASSPTVPIMKKTVEAYQKANETDKALAAYVRLIEISSGPDKEPFYGFMSYLNAKKTPGQAASFLADHLNMFPESCRPEVQAYLGTAYGQEGSWRQSIEAYKRALADGVDNPLIHLNLAEAYSRIGRYQQAEESLVEYLKKKPEDVDAKLRLASVYRNRKKNRPAIRTLEEIIKEHPKMLKAHLALV